MFDENEQMLSQRLAELRQYEIVSNETGLVRKDGRYIKFYLCGANKLDMSFFYKAYDQMESNVSHLIFIFTYATIQIKKLKVYKDVLRIEFFSVSELQRLLTGNRLIPPHRLVDETTTAEIVRRFGKENLPHILQTDPIVRLYDFPLDAVIEIERMDTVYYRLVVPDES